MKVRSKQLSDSERIETLDALYTAASSIHGRDAMKLFLRDLLTPSERIMLARRIQIAKRLLRGWTYHEVMRDLHVGQDTIQKVDRWLEQKFEAYKSILPPLVPKEVKKSVDPRIYSSLRKRYRWDYLLINLLLGDA